MLCTVDMQPITALAIHGLLTLALRHPDMTPNMRRTGETLCNCIEDALVANGASQELIAKLRSEATP